MTKISPPKANILGPEDQAFIREHLQADVTRLLFKFQKDPAKRMLIEQIAARQAIRKKLPELYNEPNLKLAPKQNLEQCSSEAVAKLKGEMLGHGQTLLDLSGGFGVDFRYLMAYFQEGYFVEPDLDLMPLSRRHLEDSLMEKKLHFHAVTAEKFIGSKPKEFDLAYIDPSRRSGAQKRLFAVEEYQPNLVEILPDLRQLSSKTYAKLSPMIPIEAYLKRLPNVAEVWVISERNECKEVGFLWREDRGSYPPLIRCWDIQGQDFKYYAAQSKPNLRAELGEINKYLYLPNSSILKAGLQDQVAEQFDLRKLDVNTQLFTSEGFVENFPGRSFRVLSLHKAYASELKKRAFQVISRNFPDKPQQIEAKLKIKLKNATEFLIATSHQGKGIFIRCERLVHSTRLNGE